jgi:hypothetical protein
VEGRVRVTPPREVQLRVVQNGITPWLVIFWGRNYIMLLWILLPIRYGKKLDCLRFYLLILSRPKTFGKWKFGGLLLGMEKDDEIEESLYRE